MVILVCTAARSSNCRHLIMSQFLVATHGSQNIADMFVLLYMCTLVVTQENGIMLQALTSTEFVQICAYRVVFHVSLVHCV